MKSKVTNQYSEEAHPWNWYIPKEASKLFIGTFPSDTRNRKHNFFYCSSTNRFWEVLSALVDQPLSLLEGNNGILERQKILKKLNLGLTDMGKRVLRQQGSSKDHSLFPLEFIDIIEILNEYHSINTLILSGNVQGNSSLSWFTTYCSLNDLNINIKELTKEKHTIISMLGKEINLEIAYSPSRLSRKTTEVLIEAYRSLLSPNKKFKM